MATELNDFEHPIKILQWAATKRAALKKELRELDMVESDAKGEIIEALGEDTKGTLNGATVVTYSQGTTHRLNQKRLAEEKPDVFDLYYDEVPQRTFRVVAPK